MHIKMTDVASRQFNFVVATNALRKAKNFQLDDTEHLNSALKISIGKFTALQDNAKKVDLLDRMLNNVCSSMVSRLDLEILWRDGDMSSLTPAFSRVLKARLLKSRWSSILLRLKCSNLLFHL